MYCFGLQQPNYNTKIIKLYKPFLIITIIKISRLFIQYIIVINLEYLNISLFDIDKLKYLLELSNINKLEYILNDDDNKNKNIKKDFIVRLLLK